MITTNIFYLSIFPRTVRYEDFNTFKGNSGTLSNTIDGFKKDVASCNLEGIINPYLDKNFQVNIEILLDFPWSSYKQHQQIAVGVVIQDTKTGLIRPYLPPFFKSDSIYGRIRDDEEFVSRFSPEEFKRRSKLTFLQFSEEARQILESHHPILSQATYSVNGFEENKTYPPTKTFAKHDDAYSHLNVLISEEFNYKHIPFDEEKRSDLQSHLNSLLIHSGEGFWSVLDALLKINEQEDARNIRISANGLEIIPNKLLGCTFSEMWNIITVISRFTRDDTQLFEYHAAFNVKNRRHKIYFGKESMYRDTVEPALQKYLNHLVGEAREVKVRSLFYGI